MSAFMEIKLTPQQLTGENRLWMAEVTPAEGGGRPWRSPAPMTVGNLMAALRAEGCSQPDIDKALREASAQYSQEFRDAEAEEKFGPTLRAAFAAEYEVPPQRAIAEPLIAYALFIDNLPETIASVVDTADYMWRLVPTADELSWAFVRLKRRGWLLVNGKLYGLTAEGKSAIASVVGEEGDQFDKIKRLEAWTSVHPI